MATPKDPIKVVIKALIGIIQDAKDINGNPWSQQTRLEAMRILAEATGLTRRGTVSRAAASNADEDPFDSQEDLLRLVNEQEAQEAEAKEASEKEVG